MTVSVGGEVVFPSTITSSYLVMVKRRLWPGGAICCILYSHVLLHHQQGFPNAAGILWKMTKYDLGIFIQEEEEDVTLP